MEKILIRAAEELLAWYDENHRVLPWRQDPTPYHVWLSEIMLQQTRVEAVKMYYARFLEALPTIEALANAPEEVILKLWEGLGYYNRVRNMQTAAKTIMDRMQGEFPQYYEEILTLKGIGEYTAGAIASIAFHEAVPAVDGNALRVFQRLTGSFGDITKRCVIKEVRDKIKGMLPMERPGDFNQALMDLGAMVCIPNGAPHCDICPWQEYCVARQKKLTDRIPVKTKKLARKQEKKTVFLLFAEQKVALTRRENKGLLAGMWQFPMVDGTKTLKETDTQMKQDLPGVDYHVKASSNGKHIFSHIEWQMKARTVEMEKIPDNTCFFGQEIVWVSLEELNSSYPVPSAFSVYRDIVVKRLAK